MVGKRNTFINSIVWILLIVLLCTNLLSVHVQAAETTAEGFEYVEENGTIKITGYTGTNTDVDIPEKINGKPVTSIGMRAFEEKGLTSITIPNNITEIADFAFSSNQLTSVTIPNSVTRIAGCTFSSNRLTSVTIPNSVTQIAYYAFGDNQLTSVTIPDSVLYLAGFNGNKLTDITIPNSVTEIGWAAFANNQLTNVTIPDSVTEIADLAFESNQLTSVIIPSSVTTIRDRAFFNNKLSEINIPASVTLIHADAFSNNKLLSVNLPDSLKAIGMGAFKNNLISKVKIPSSIEEIYGAIGMGAAVPSIMNPTDAQVLEYCFDPGVTLIEDVPAPNEPIPDETPAPSEAKPTEPTTTPTTAPTTTPAPAEPVEIEMVEATVGWTTGSDQPAVFTSNAEFADFLHVTIDGNIVAAENYEVKEGSTIVSFKPRFLAALSPDSYPVEIVSKTGVAKGVLEIKAQVTPEPVNVTPTTQPTQSTETLPRTGENSGLYLWMVLVFLSASGLLYVARKKKVSKQ
ncbi:MAG TPA: leucine-rich repeat protein [Clostridiaceae bacterium]|nr:leucine-rich repeat protein [Clostridiaceae bacterium]